MAITAALLGFGNVARHAHLPWFRASEEVQLTGIVEPTSGGRALARALVPDVPVFPTLKALLDSGRPDFVDVTAPPAAHVDLVVAALDAGMHVLCEKPFVLSASALDRVRQAWARSCRTVAACHNWTYAPSIRHALDAVRDGRIGRPERFRLAMQRRAAATGAPHWQPSWRLASSHGGGIIGDLGYHGIYLAAAVFGRPPRSVCAHADDTSGAEDAAERVARIEIDFGSMQSAHLAMSWLGMTRETRLQIDGSEGTVAVANDEVRLVTGTSEQTELVPSLVSDSWHAGWTAGCLDGFLSRLDASGRLQAWKEIEWTVGALAAALESIGTAPQDLGGGMANGPA